ncbi:MAG: hypothetical protein QGH60_01070 [Phycisphaerae bacterium]|jgi:hypothetical protein|nr:hypothetical protein [Phycisphaerae bacterium]
MNYQCCICNDAIADGAEGHRLDPCAIVIVTNLDSDRRDQREQTFYCHIECFRQTVGDDGVMYIMEKDFSTVGEIEDEEVDEGGSD